MTTLAILADVDGLLANFTDAFLDHANRVTGMHVTFGDIHDWDILKCYPPEHHASILERVSEKGFCYELSVMPGAEEAINSLRTLGDVYAVTSPWVSETWCHERTRWLRDKLGFQPKDVLHVAGERKHLVRGDVFIDDKLETILDWSAANPEGLALLWDTPYNRHGMLTSRSFRVYCWEAVTYAVQTYAKASA